VIISQTTRWLPSSLVSLKGDWLRYTEFLHRFCGWGGLTSAHLKGGMSSTCRATGVRTWCWLVCECRLRRRFRRDVRFSGPGDKNLPLSGSCHPPSGDELAGWLQVGRSLSCRASWASSICSMSFPTSSYTGDSGMGIWYVRCTRTCVSRPSIRKFRVSCVLECGVLQ